MIQIDYYKSHDITPWFTATIAVHVAKDGTVVSVYANQHLFYGTESLTLNNEF